MWEIDNFKFTKCEQAFIKTSKHLRVPDQKPFVEALKANKLASAVVTVVSFVSALSSSVVNVALRQDADIASTSVAALEPRHSALLVRSVAAVIFVVAGQAEADALAVVALKVSTLYLQEHVCTFPRTGQRCQHRDTVLTCRLSVFNSFFLKSKSNQSPATRLSWTHPYSFKIRKSISRTTTHPKS